MCADCLICNNRKATQTNSHIIPSFLVAMVSSYDGSYKRGKELMFTISSFQEKTYTGALPDTKLEEIFDTDNLTDERIKNELSDNTVAKDYIFCPVCERNLSRYLETPYAESLFRDKKIDYDIPVFFWISVIWRMSSCGNFYGFKLPDEINDKLHDNLKQYLQMKEEGQDISLLLRDINFQYKILQCKDFCKSNAGYIYCQYNERDNILVMSMGDLCVCGMFGVDTIPEDFVFFGLESLIKDAPINSGNDHEKRHNVEPDDYKKSIQEFVKVGAKLRLNDEFQILDKMWELSGFGRYMPIRMKMLFLQMLYNERVKIGERHTMQRYIDIFTFLRKKVYLWY